MSDSRTRSRTGASGCCGGATTSTTGTTTSAGSTLACSSSPTCGTQTSSSSRCRPGCPSTMACTSISSTPAQRCSPYPRVPAGVGTSASRCSPERARLTPPAPTTVSKSDLLVTRGYPISESGRGELGSFAPTARPKAPTDAVEAFGVERQISAVANHQRHVAEVAEERQLGSGQAEHHEGDDRDQHQRLCVPRHR